DRRSLVELMTYDENGGMTTRQIGNALGVGKDTVARDVAAVANATGERTVQGSDGKLYTVKAKPEPTVSERDWPVVPEPTPEERIQKFEDTRERLINEGYLPKPRTEEERKADAKEYVESLIGKKTRPATPATPEEQIATALKTI